jgi:L-lactate dehydrogenase complex protein LldG
MLKEQTGFSFFSKMKSAFSTSERENSYTINPDITREEIITEELSESVFPVFKSRVSNESVTEKEISVRTVGVSAPTYSLSQEKDLDIRFATKFLGAGGKFVFCENLKAAVDNLKLLKQEQGWSHVFCWENEIKDAFCDNNFQKGAIGYTIENSDAAISLCETLIADEGLIILNPKQASRRRLHCFPKTHIIITDIAHLAGSEAEGLEKFYSFNKGELPSIIKLGSCNKSHFYDKQRLILNSEGTEDVYVFLLDELILPSLRP